jgi:hypothetical protein
VTIAGFGRAARRGAGSVGPSALAGGAVTVGSAFRIPVLGLARLVTTAGPASATTCCFRSGGL